MLLQPQSNTLDHDDGPALNRRNASVMVVPAAFIIFIAVVVLFARAKDYGLLGFDTYPIIITSRIQSFEDLKDNFTEKLMHGRYTSDFYRPLVNLSFALDYSIWGLRPSGYHLTNTMLFGACAGSLFLLMRRLTGGQSWIAPYVALLFFILHPSHWEVIPVPPRRADVMCCLALALSISIQLDPRALARNRAAVTPAIWMMLAIASKETALVFPALSFLVVLLYSKGATFGQRMLHALVAVIPHAIVFLILLAARFAVIGGLGGHHSASLFDIIQSIPHICVFVGNKLVRPETLSVGLLFGTWLAFAVLFGLATVAGLTVFRRAMRQGIYGLTGWRWRVLVVALSWAGLLMVTNAIARIIAPWYLLLAVASFSMVVGVVVDALVKARGRGTYLTKGVAGATLILVAGWAWGQVRFAPIWYRYEQWSRATQTSDQFFEELLAKIEIAPDGSIVQAPLIHALPCEQHPAALDGVALFDLYSIQAWAELSFPDRLVRVVSKYHGIQTGPGEVVVVVHLPGHMRG